MNRMTQGMADDAIRVLVVDDSAVARAMLCDHLAAAPGISVAGTACNGREAIAANVSLCPDVITLDLQMPKMNGLTVLDAILDRGPVPVIIVSSLTRAGAAITLEALDRGAVDYVAKPDHETSDWSTFAAELAHKVHNAASIDVNRVIAGRKRLSDWRQKPAAAATVASAGQADLGCQCIAIGVSTGGPPALARLLESLRPPMPPIVIVQHMPAQFTGPLAARLDGLSALSVHEAAHGDLLQPNCVYVAPGGKHLELHGVEPRVRAVLRDGPVVSGHRPSVDVMMTTAAKVYGPGCLGVIMTGMGRDGVSGCRAIRAAGGYVLGQDEASSDVYGMNRAAFVEGNVDRQFGLDEAAAVVSRQVRRLACPAGAV
jgi:two-component system, chemotaxis family, protein-glutamate methylesterase/glutaminase